MLKLLKNKKGVTLVELLAVIIIMGIITAIAVPTIGKLVDNQKRNAAEAQWEAIIDAAELYQAAEPDDADHLVTLDELTDDTDGTPYITLDASWEFTSDEAGETPILATALTFDITDVVTASLPANTTIYLNGYLVETTPAA